MGRGCHLEPITRKIIYELGVVQQRNPHSILDFIQRICDQTLSLSHLINIISKMNLNKSWKDGYLAGPNKQTGRKRILTDFQQRYLLTMVKNKPNICLNDLRYQFIAQFFPNNQENHRFVSLSTISRTIRRADYTKKVLERRHINQNPVLRMEYMDNMKYIDPLRIIDVDETLSTEKELRRRYGYAPRGERAVMTQIHIDNKHYSVIAAYSPNGFICWDIVEGSFTAECFIKGVFHGERSY